MGVRDETIVYFDGVLKILGVCHGILGGLLIVMGVVVRLAVDHWTSVMLLARWIGVIVSPIHTSFSQNDLYQFYSMHFGACSLYGKEQKRRKIGPINL